MAQRRLEVVIVGDAKGAKDAFDDTEKGSDSLADKMRSALGGAGTAVAAGAVAGLAGVGMALKGAYEAAVESQKISNETERVIRTTGSAANVTADQVGELAGHLSDLTGIDDEVVQGAENLLLTFTNVKNEVGEGNDVFTQATALALDMSTALGTDASGAAIQLGKALNDPVKGITALSKAGVSFTEQQKDQIKEMVKAGDTLGAQKVVLAELSKEFGGAAEAAGTPLEKLQVKIGNLQEEVGARLIPIVNSAATWIGDNLPAAIETATGFLSDHMDAVEALATVGLVTLAAAYGPVIAGQVAMVASGVAGFFAEVVSSAIYAGQAFMTVAAQQGVLTASTQVLTYAMSSAAFALPAVGLAVFAVMHFYNDGAKAAEDFSKAVAAKVDTSSLNGLREALAQNKAEMDRVGQAGSTMAERFNLPAMLSAQRTYDDLGKTVEDLAGTVEAREHVFWDTARAIQASQDPAVRTTEGLQKLHDQLDAIASQEKIDPTASGSAQKLTELQAAASNTNPVLAHLAESAKTVGAAASDADDQVKAFKQDLDALFGVHIAAAQAANSFGASLDSVRDKVGAGSNLLDVYNAKNREASGAVLASADSALKYSVSLLEEGRGMGVASDALARNREQLVNTMVQTGMNRGAAEAYINTLNLTPANIQTLAHMNKEQAQAATNELIGRLDNAQQPRHGSITVDVSQAISAVNSLQSKLQIVGQTARSGNLAAAGAGLAQVLQGRADGGITLHQFADGGHIAQIARAGAMRLWAEPETGGEAYIPLASAKRTRSTQILAQVADMFGYEIQSSSAGGGGMRPRKGTGAGGGLTVNLYGVAATKADVGRALDEALREYQRQGGSLVST